MVGEEMGGRRNWRVIVVFASRMERERLVRKRKRNNKEETKKLLGWLLPARWLKERGGGRSWRVIVIVRVARENKKEVSDGEKKKQ